MIMTSNEFGTPGREYWFSIRAKNKKLTLNWSNVELLKKYVAKQRGAHIWKTGLNYQITDCVEKTSNHKRSSVARFSS